MPSSGGVDKAVSTVEGDLELIILDPSHPQLCLSLKPETLRAMSWAQIWLSFFTMYNRIFQLKSKAEQSTFLLTTYFLSPSRRFEQRYLAHPISHRPGPVSNLTQCINRVNYQRPIKKLATKVCMPSQSPKHAQAAEAELAPDTPDGSSTSIAIGRKASPATPASPATHTPGDCGRGC